MYFSKSIESVIYHTSSQIDYYKIYFPWLVNKSKFIRFGTDYDYFTEIMNRIPEDKCEKEFCICVGYNKRDWDTVISAYKLAKPANLNLRLIGHVDKKYSDIEGVEQIGFVPVKELIRYIKMAKFSILPLKSFNYSYGQMTLMQQMLMRKCVITAKVPSVVDYVEDGKTAILYEPENAAQLAEKILLINKDEELRVKIATNAERYIREECNEKIMALQIEEELSCI